MVKNNKKVSLCIISFIVSFIFIIFVQSLNINSTRNVPLKSEKENAIFFEKTNGSENYISMRISRSNTFEIFTGRLMAGASVDPNFVKKMEEYIFLPKKLRLSERTAGEIFSLCSILQRYRERILLI